MSYRFSPPRLPSKIVEKSRQQNDAWCVVSADGSTSIIGCKSAHAASESIGHNPEIVPDRATALENLDADLPDAREVGVDLSYLNVEEETTSKLIAGMNAMTVDQATSALRRKITMPVARTDLHEIFKTDNVCMVTLSSVVGHR